MQFGKVKVVLEVVNCHVDAHVDASCVSSFYYLFFNCIWYTGDTDHTMDHLCR